MQSLQRALPFRSMSYIYVINYSSRSRGEISRVVQSIGRDFASIEKLKESDKDEPSGKWKYVGIGVGAAVVGVGAVVAAPFALAAVGFTATGITGGSIAAGMMSAAAIANGGGVAAGSLVAILQSAGAIGLGAAGTAGVAGAGAAVGGGITGAAMAAFNRLRGRSSDEPQRTPKEIAHILEKHAKNVLSHSSDEDNRFQCLNISRSNILKDALEEFQKQDFSKDKFLKISFIPQLQQGTNETEIDTEKQRREFFHLLLKEIFKSGDFVGSLECKIFSPSVSSNSRQLNLPKYYGMMFGASIIMGGEAPSCLPGWVIEYIIRGSLPDIVCNIDEMADSPLKDGLKSLIGANNDAEATDRMQTILGLGIELGADFSLTPVDMERKKDMANAIAVSYCLLQPLKKFKEGLEEYKMVTLLQNYPDLACILRASNRFDVNADMLKESVKFEMSPVGSDVHRFLSESCIGRRFFEYIDTIAEKPRTVHNVELNLMKLMEFMSGAERVPPCGMPQITCKFEHDQTLMPVGSYPFASSCTNTIIFPVYGAMQDKEIFSGKMDLAIIHRRNT